MIGKLTGKKVVIIVAQEFEDVELLYPVLRLSEEGAEIVVVPVNRYRVSRFEELKAAEIDCVLFPGGYSPDALRLHAGTLELVRECHRQGKLLAAICHGPWVLISAGIMEGKRATGYIAVRDDLVNAGAKFIDVPAVRDGNILTGRVPDDLPEFCQEIIMALAT
jgi:protease I